MSHSISDMHIGQTLEVSGFAGGDRGYRQKLLAMGVTRGTPITLLRVAPLGDPVEIRVRGYTMSLRKHEASMLRLTATSV